MRTLAPLLALLLVLPALIPGPAGASAGGPHVDAGASVLATRDVPFLLRGHVEGFPDPAAVSVAWTAPPGCVLPASGLLLASATCSVPGVHAFALEAGDGIRQARDEVLVLVRGDETTRLLDMRGTIPYGAAGLPAPWGTFQVPAGLHEIRAVLSWTGAEGPIAHDLDLQLTRGGPTHAAASRGPGPETLTVADPEPGWWTATVRTERAFEVSYRLTVDGARRVGGDVPTLAVPSLALAPGETAVLVAQATGAAAPFTVAWETDPASRRFDEGEGLSFSFPFQGATRVLAKLTDALGFEAIAEARVGPAGGPPSEPVTVVAVLDDGFSPYHADFLAAYHPWNQDDEPGNDFAFDVDPATYIPGHPGAVRVNLTLPASLDEGITTRRTLDGAAWARFPASSANHVRMAWFPGTKIVGAVRFGEFHAPPTSHGSASASVAAGNLHGACRECVFVLVASMEPYALSWVASQPWIDVVTNSYGHSVVGGPVRDNVYWRSPVDATRAAAERGQTIVFSAGNGLLNAFDAPMFTYWSSEKGPDWIVTVGAVSPGSQQTYSGAGKPVDVSSIGSGYPSSGGSTAGGKGTHGGTSNAAPVTAGYFAKVLHEARVALGDLTPGHSGGVVAQGGSVPCGAAVPACALGDGVLTSRELRELVFHNALPSPTRAALQTWPSTAYAYYYQGHGVLTGRSEGAARFDAEWTRMLRNAKGEVAAHERPPGEQSWFSVDSKCRQRLWGAWSGGYYRGVDPVLDPVEDPLAHAYDAWCSRLPQGPFLR